MSPEIKQLPESIIKKLDNLTESKDYRGKLKSADFKSFLAELNLNENQLLLLLTDYIKKFAKPTISGFYVGAAVKTSTGNVYLALIWSFPRLI